MPLAHIYLTDNIGIGVANMTGNTYTLLEYRGILAVSGEDSREFLQGLVSNDVDRIGPKSAIYAAFLTPQGKFLHDFFMVEFKGAILLECEAARGDDLAQRLERYKLRSKVEIEDVTGKHIVAVLNGENAASAVGAKATAGAVKQFGGGVVYVDPRLAEAGVRAILPRASAVEDLEAKGFLPGPAGQYDAIRLGLGLPDGSRDLDVEKSILMESGFDELNGIDWNKGCYLGQELTARTRYRGTVKKRLIPVSIDGPLPEPGATILLDGKEAGEMRSGRGNLGIALMRLDALEKAAVGGEFKSGRSVLMPQKPDWAAF